MSTSPPPVWVLVYRVGDQWEYRISHDKPDPHIANGWMPLSYHCKSYKELRLYLQLGDLIPPPEAYFLPKEQERSDDTFIRTVPPWREPEGDGN